MFDERFKTNVPTDLLRTFVTVCEVRNFTEAAQLLQLTQPAVSRQIEKLEIFLGSEVIDHRLSGVNLTQTGSEVLSSARRLLSINDQLILECTDQPSRFLRLGVPNLFASRLLPSMVAAVRSKAPQAQLQICCDTAPNLFRLLRLGYLDVAIVYSDPKEIVHAACFWTEEVGWVRARSFTARTEGPVPIIGSPNVLRVDQIATEALRRDRQPYNIVFSAVDFGARLAAVAAGLGYLPLTRRLVPPDLVVEEQTSLPPLASLLVGIFVREGADKKALKPLVDALEAVVRIA